MADRYLVGLTFNSVWVPNTALPTSHWSTTSGGTSGAAIPTYLDDVYIDNNSGSGILYGNNIIDNTGMSNSTQNCRNLTVTATQDITLWGGYLNIYGDLSLPSTGSFKFMPNYDGSETKNQMRFWKNSGTVTITTNGVRLPYNVIFGGTYTGTAPNNINGGNGATFVFTSTNTLNDFNCLGTCTVWWGTFNTNDITIRAGSFVSRNFNAGFKRVLNFGSSRLILTGNTIGGGRDTLGVYDVAQNGYGDLTENLGTSTITYMVGKTDNFFTMFTNSSTK